MANASHTSSRTVTSRNVRAAPEGYLVVTRAVREVASHKHPVASSMSLRIAHTMGVASHPEETLLHRQQHGNPQGADDELRSVRDEDTRRTRRPKNIGSRIGGMRRICFERAL